MHNVLVLWKSIADKPKPFCFVVQFSNYVVSIVREQTAAVYGHEGHIAAMLTWFTNNLKPCKLGPESEPLCPIH